MSSQTLDLEVNEKEYAFTINREAYNRFIKGVKDNPAPAMFNLLTMTVEPEKQNELTTFLKETAGAEMQLAGALLEAYIPDLEVVVKKRKA